MTTKGCKDKPVQKFKDHFAKGRGFLVRAVELEENAKNCKSNDRAKKAEACELYKKGIDEFKLASDVHLSNIPKEQMKEISDMITKMHAYLKSATERFEFLGPSAVGQMEVDPALALRGIPITHSPKIRRDPPPRIPARYASSREREPNDTTEFFGPASIQKQKMLRNVSDKTLGAKLLDEILDLTSFVVMDDVVGCGTAKAAFEEAVIFPRYNPELFTGLRKPVKGILLFGPPGNGKTMLARAVAGATDMFFLNVSASNLTSKWVGEGEKTMRCLFEIARTNKRCIIFIDEIDSILCARTEKDSEASRRMKTEFLVQFDGVSNEDEGKLLVIGATNRPYELDDAVLRRFPKRILLPLPDDAGRYVFIKRTLDQHGHLAGLGDADIRYVASRTSGYSYSDLMGLCKEAAMAPVRDLSRAKLSTTNKKALRNLKPGDFDIALTKIRPSTKEDTMEALEDFAREAGSK